MEIIAAFAIIVFLLGLSIGLLYRRMHKRRLARLAQENLNADKTRNSSAPLDKPMSRS